jgi:hypothetical protein
MRVLKGDGLVREGLDENLHTSTETQDETESGLLGRSPASRRAL